MSFRLFSLFLIGCVIIRVNGKYGLTGLIGSVSQQTVSKAVNFVVPKITEKLTGITLPTVEMVAPVPLLGDYKITISGMTILSVDLSGVQVKLQQPRSAALDVSGFTAKINATISYRGESWPHVSDTVKADIFVNPSSFVLVLNITEVNGKPHIVTASSVASIGKIDISLSGGASWLYDIVINLFQSTITDAVKNVLEVKLPQIIDEKSEELFSSISFIKSVTPLVLFDIELSGNPNVTKPFSSEILSIPFTGAFIDSQTKTYPPLPTANFPKIDFEKGVQAIISDYVVDSLLYTLTKTNSFNHSISYFDFANEPIYQRFLNTNFYRFIIGPLYQKYPDRPMKVNFNIVNPPTARFDASKGIRFNATGLLTVYVYSSNSMNSNLIEAFVLDVGLGIDMLAKVKSETKLSIELKLTNLTLSVHSSNIGSFTLDGVENLLRTAIDLALDYVNSIFSSFEIPTVDGITILDPEIIWGDSYCQVTFDVSFKPKTRYSYLRKLLRFGKQKFFSKL